MGQLSGKTAVITGASSGIGRSIALAFARAGAELLITYRASAAGAQAVAQEIAALGAQVHVLQADLASVAACQHLVAQAHSALSRFDIWVNNAGADVLTTEAARWDWARKLDLLYAVDLRGTLACCHAAAPFMQAQPAGGCIINMSWDHVTTGMAGENPQLFAAIKGGVLAYSKSLARALAPQVRVNVLAPGWIETSFGATADRAFYEQIKSGTPLQRWGSPDDVAAAAVYLASPAAGFVTGQTINVNGGVVM